MLDGLDGAALVHDTTENDDTLSGIPREGWRFADDDNWQDDETLTFTGRNEFTSFDPLC